MSFYICENHWSEITPLTKAEIEKLLKTNWDEVGFPECSGYAEILIPEILRTALALYRVKEKAERIDKPCRKYGVLPKNQICSDISNWKEYPEYKCPSCALSEALKPFQKDGGS